MWFDHWKLNADILSQTDCYFFCSQLNCMFGVELNWDSVAVVYTEKLTFRSLAFHDTIANERNIIFFSFCCPRKRNFKHFAYWYAKNEKKSHCSKSYLEYFQRFVTTSTLKDIFEFRKKLLFWETTAEWAIRKKIYEISKVEKKRKCTKFRCHPLRTIQWLWSQLFFLSFEIILFSILASMTVKRLKCLSAWNATTNSDFISVSFSYNHNNAKRHHHRFHFSAIRWRAEKKRNRMLFSCIAINCLECLSNKFKFNST